VAMGNTPFVAGIEAASPQAIVAARGRKTAEAKALITQALSAGPRPAREVMAAAEARSITRGTLYTAKERLHVRSARHGDVASGWDWELPQRARRSARQIPSRPIGGTN
jgi:hypothetical protein